MPYQSRRGDVTLAQLSIVHILLSHIQTQGAYCTVIAMTNPASMQFNLHNHPILNHSIQEPPLVSSCQHNTTILLRILL